jgi:hypothetical protein
LKNDKTERKETLSEIEPYFFLLFIYSRRFSPSHSSITIYSSASPSTISYICTIYGQWMERLAFASFFTFFLSSLLPIGIPFHAKCSFVARCSTSCTLPDRPVPMTLMNLSIKVKGGIRSKEKKKMRKQSSFFPRSERGCEDKLTVVGTGRGAKSVFAVMALILSENNLTVCMDMKMTK